MVCLFVKRLQKQSILYVKSIEGVGKSTFTDFFIKYVLGNELYAKGDKECLCTANNMDLLGKPFVVFEELPVMNKNEWNVCDGKLKDMTTGTEINFCDKYCKKFRAANINSYCIITNHKAVKTLSTAMIMNTLGHYVMSVSMTRQDMHFITTY